ncbi:DUF3179 domain-containing (seleno)protein [Flammeovirga sp. OC4]|uniref:DUF3179 domain-containing (seleno)protein n=1 Tax=Flammeovirga sp. OC4 TaxID=1382345 RepID=UPI0005C6C8C3|nr:DUF3179 domain-containing (seleno)protein [Flammeovirga sp. OC4]
MISLKNIVLLFFAFGVVFNASAQINRVGVKSEWATNVDNSSISLYEYESLVPKDAFQSIDNPRFYNEESAAEEYSEESNVVVVAAGREFKAYPLDFLMYHQVINDRIGGMPIAITYCPLTDAVQVYERRFQYKGVQRELTFNPSGMIRKSNIILYDTQSESWWQQYNGKSYTGEFKGHELTKYPALRMTMKQYYENYKYGLVMKFNERDELLPYGKNPYYNYDNVLVEKPLYLNYMPNERLMPMERVVAVALLDEHVIYPLEDVKDRGVINDKPLDMYIAVFYDGASTSMLEGRAIHSNKKIGSVAVYSSFHEGQSLTFSKEGDVFKDEQTQSIWNFSGRCIEGELKGQQLKMLNFSQNFSFPALDFYPNSLIYNINW